MVLFSSSELFSFTCGLAVNNILQLLSTNQGVRASVTTSVTMLVAIMLWIWSMHEHTVRREDQDLIERAWKKTVKGRRWRERQWNGGMETWQSYKGREALRKMQGTETCTWCQPLTVRKWPKKKVLQLTIFCTYCRLTSVREHLSI